MISKILMVMVVGATLCLAQEGDSGASAQPPAPVQKDSAGAAQPGAVQPKAIQPQAVAPPSLLSLAGLGRVPGLQNTQNMFFALDEGQAVKGVYSGDTAANKKRYYTPLDKVWQQNMVLYLTEALTYRERLKFIVSIECDLVFSLLPIQQFPATTSPYFNFYPNDVEVNYSFGNLERPWLQIALGYFPYKYNPDAKDLGEYLMRSEAYPSLIVTDFEFPMTRELGLRVGGFAGNPAIDEFKWDLLLTSETHGFPQQDGTLTGVVSNSLFNMLDIGAGVSFQRLFPVSDANTTPKRTNAIWPDGNMYFKENGDTEYYSFSAIKLMGRASLNPLRFVPEFKIPPSFIFGTKPFFGKEDLKIYGEVAVLGLNSYVAYDSVADSLGVNHWQRLPDTANLYDNIRDRMPIMAGINLPTNPIISYGILPFLLTKWLKDETGSDIRQLAWITLVPAVLGGVAEQYLGWNLGPDVLSLEFEWFSQRFPNSDRTAVDPNTNLPLPISNDYRTIANFGRPEPTKYALYFKKSFMNRFALSGLVGRDHMRPVEMANPQSNQTDDFLQTGAHWYWMLRLSANF
jgi:hypothetical protein